MKIKEKEMNISQTYRPASVSQEPTSALRGLMQRLGLAFLAGALAIGVIGSASAGDARDEATVRSLGDTFAKAFVEKNAELRASLFTENGTFVTPTGDFWQGRVAMVKDFGTEAQAVNGTTQAAFSNYRVRFIKPDVAVVDAILTVHNVNGPDGTIIPVIPINFFYVAARHGDKWLIEDGRAHFAPAPANSMTSRN
ncbi:MAG TPA: SgcJ/EcaC family oxidoreductase [Candidatus Acidoferrum sp.]